MQPTAENTTPQSDAPQGTELTHPATAAVQAKAKKPAPKTRAAKAKAAKSPATQPQRFVKAPAAAAAPEADATPETQPQAQPLELQATLEAFAAQPLPVPATQRVLQYDNPQDMEYLAKALAKFVKDNKLVSDVQGKQFVNVEGWAYAGSRLGYMPLVKDCTDQSTQDEIKYQATVAIMHLATGTQVGAGWAVCSNKESGKKYYQEFAINSMAQTRATGKAYRNILGWVMKAAGYEACPLEEMNYNTPPEQPQAALPAAAPTAAPEPAVVDATTETGQPAPAAAATVPNPAAALKVLPLTGKEGQEMPAQEGQAAPVTYATAEQKEEIIRRLNHPVIKLAEKSKMLLNINRLDEERATQALEKLAKTIKDREEEQNGKGGNTPEQTA